MPLTRTNRRGHAPEKELSSFSFWESRRNQVLGRDRVRKCSHHGSEPSPVLAVTQLRHGTDGALVRALRPMASFLLAIRGRLTDVSAGKALGVEYAMRSSNLRWPFVMPARVGPRTLDSLVPRRDTGSVGGDPSSDEFFRGDRSRMRFLVWTASTCRTRQFPSTGSSRPYCRGSARY